MATIPLHARVAILKSKTGGEKEAGIKGPMTAANHAFQSAAGFSGFTKEFEPFEVADGERTEYKAPESKPIQHTVTDVLSRARREWAEIINLQHAVDFGNKSACADLVFDGQTIASAVPVSTLVSLRNRLLDLKTLITSIPELPPGDWEFDTARGCHKWEKPRITTATRKEMVPVTKAAATATHQAVAELVSVDKPIGKWTEVQFHTGMPATQKLALLDRIGLMLEAVKIAHFTANGIDSYDSSLGTVIDRAIFG